VLLSDLGSNGASQGRLRNYSCRSAVAATTSRARRKRHPDLEPRPDLNEIGAAV